MKQFLGMLLLCITLLIPPAALAGETQAATTLEQAEAKAYFDSRTGHKYLKSDNQTYMEFDKKGQYLKTVPNTLPLLLNGRSIHPVSEENYILYKKSVQGKIRFISLLAASPHPEGWHAHKLLLAVKDRYAYR